MRNANIVERIESNNYIATPDQVTELTRQYALAANRRDYISGTYLSVLVAGVQSALKTADIRPADILLRIDEVNRVYYAAVMKGLTASGIKGADVRRRNGFARSAKSTLVFFVKYGGDIREIEAGKISKEKLRQAHKTAAPSVSLVRRSANVIIARIEKLASTDINEARGELLWVFDLVQAELKKLKIQPESKAPRVTGHRLQRTETRHSA